MIYQSMYVIVPRKKLSVKMVFTFLYVGSPPGPERYIWIQPNTFAMELVKMITRHTGARYFTTKL